MRRYIFFISVFVGVLLVWMHSASAATLSVIVDRNTAAIGDTFTAELLVASEDASINAIQGTLTYPKDLAEAINIDTNSSAFDFWLQKPPVSDKTGVFSFISGSSNGYKGRSLLVWKATFRIKGSGPIQLDLNNAAVVANDGNGTNVLAKVRGAFLASVPASEIVAASPPDAVSSSPTSTAVPPVLVPVPPVQIQRKPTEASSLPDLPQLEIPLYPQPDQWYNVRENFLVKWLLPPDISAVATAYTQNPTTVPATSEGLFDNKIFPAPESGISYVHIRFKNKLGWGKTLHYRIAVDTVPPAAFTAFIEEGTTTDTPTPTVVYRTSDPISRIKGYVVRVDAQRPIRTTEERIVLPVLLPGKHTVHVEAFDESGNSTESNVEVMITPLLPPIFSDISNEVYIGEGKMNVAGGGMPSSTVVLTLRNEIGQVIEILDTSTNNQGNWRATFDRPLVKGMYAVEAFTRDNRGATSFVVRSHDIRVRERPFLVFAGREITQMIFFLAVILLLLVGFIIGWILRSIQKKRRAWKAVISQRDVVSAMDGIATDTEEILEKFKKDKLGERQAFEAKRLLTRLLKRTKSAKSYLLRGIDDLNK